MTVVGWEFIRPGNESVVIWAPVFSSNEVPAFNRYVSARELEIETGGDFDLTTTVFTNGATSATNLRNQGFKNVIDQSLYYGETWTLKGRPGSTIEFNAGNYSPHFTSPNGSNGPLFGLGSSYTFTMWTIPEGDGYSEGYCYSGAIQFATSSQLYVRARYQQAYGSKDSSIITYNDFFDDVDPIEPNDDPYGQGGATDTGGGTGDFDGRSDSIDIPELPTASATDAGFITLFNPSLSQMKSLAAYMWSDLFDLDGWRKLFANPMDAILGLSIVPVAVPSGGTKEVKVGNIGTGVSMTTASTQYVAVDCGTLNVNEYWGAYLDYEPFTKAEIYLPYIGTHAIAVDDIMGKAVHVVYHVDILSGACCAYVKCGSSVLYTFIGQCSSSIPITGDNWTNVVNGVLNIAGSIGSMVATGGASAPLALGEIASTSVNAMKPSVEKSGSMSGTGGMMAIQTPYLILTRPRQAVPKNQNKYTGYPSYITKKLSSLKGYTEVESIHIEGVYATDSEMSEMYSLLASGVIL